MSRAVQVATCHLPLSSCQLPVAPCSDKFNNVTGLAPYVRDRKVFRLASRIRQTFQNEIMSGQRSGRKKCKQIWPSGNRDKHIYAHTHTNSGTYWECVCQQIHMKLHVHMSLARARRSAVQWTVGQWDSATMGHCLASHMILLNFSKYLGEIKKEIIK